MARILIFVDQPDWHTRRLVAALEASGATAHVRSLRDCLFAVGGRGPGLVIAGLGEELPDAVLVRTIADGTFEQVTLRLSFLHALAELGVPVINSARAIERCVDKAMTSFLLHHAGIPTPETLVGERRETAARWLAEAPGELVQKPLFGSQGRGLSRLASGAELPPPETYDQVYYLQRFVGPGGVWRDFRIMVVGRRPVAAMARNGRSWITNVHRGAICEAVAISAPLAELSTAAVAAVGADYAGVDIIEDRDGSLLVLEVNSMPAWQGLQSVTDCDIAAALAAYVLDSIA